MNIKIIPIIHMQNIHEMNFTLCVLLFMLVRLVIVLSATMAIKRRPFSRLLRHAGDTEDVFST